jgi:hypothetical protein
MVTDPFLRGFGFLWQGVIGGFISGLGPKVVLSFWSQALSNRLSSF